MPANSPVTSDSSGELPTLHFNDADAFGAWLAEHHASAPGLWLKIPKKASGIAGATYSEALDEALRFGWIDSQKNKLDDDFYLQRFTPRTRRSRWSKVNTKKVGALIDSGRMEPAGMAEVERAKQDGRWDAAYDPPSTTTMPADLQAALDADPAARTFFESLSSSSRFVIIRSVESAKQVATRERRIAKYVTMCRDGEKP
jgi:uncharacterized protein YdeI (YjbR/CyaY-like superfamily)